MERSSLSEVRSFFEKPRPLNDFNAIRLGLASPEKIRSWSHGEVIKPETILAARDLVTEIYVDEKIKQYILDIVFATREPSKFGLDLDALIAYGGSPRASLYLSLAARAHAFLERQDLPAQGLDLLQSHLPHIAAAICSAVNCVIMYQDDLTISSHMQVHLEYIHPHGGIFFERV